MRGSKKQVARKLKELLKNYRNVRSNVVGFYPNCKIRVAVTPRDFVHMFSCRTTSCMDMMNIYPGGEKEFWRRLYRKHHIHPSYFYGCSPQILGIYLCEPAGKVLFRCQIVKDNETWQIGSCYRDVNITNIMTDEFKDLLHNLTKLPYRTYNRVYLTKGFKVPLFKLASKHVRYFPLPFSDDIIFSNKWRKSSNKKSIQIHPSFCGSVINPSPRRITNCYNYPGYVSVYI